MLKYIKPILKGVVRVPIRFFLRIKLVATAFPFRKPSILLLSYPRSGSSWIGKVLSTSESVVYLREPVTQPYMQKKGGTQALVDIDSDQTALSIYKKLSEEAFLGMPPKQPDIIRGIGDFSIFGRDKKSLLIKEVNPKAIEFYCTQHEPKILLILRHPAAVALSFSRQGWLDSPDVQLDTESPQANLWEKFGYAYGSTMKHALEVAQNYGNYEVIEYESFALDPEHKFKELFCSLKLELPMHYEKVIIKYCYAQEKIRDAGQIKRKSKDMVAKWKKELKPKEVLWLKKGFDLSQLEFYTNDEDWCIE